MTPAWPLPLGTHLGQGTDPSLSDGGRAAGLLLGSQPALQSFPEVLAVAQQGAAMPSVLADASVPISLSEANTPFTEAPEATVAEAETLQPQMFGLRLSAASNEEIVPQDPDLSITAETRDGQEELDTALLEIDGFEFAPQPDADQSALVVAAAPIAAGSDSPSGSSGAIVEDLNLLEQPPKRHGTEGAAQRPEATLQDISETKLQSPRAATEAPVPVTLDLAKPTAAPEMNVAAAITAPPLQTTTPDAPALRLNLTNPAWPETVVNDIVQTAITDGDSLTLTLTPERLGSLQIRLAVENGLTQVHIVTETPEAAAALQDAQQRLADAFGRAGLELGSQSAQYQGAHADAQGGSSKDNIYEAVPIENADPDAEETALHVDLEPAPARHGAQTVDLLA